MPVGQDRDRGPAARVRERDHAKTASVTKAGARVPPAERVWTERAQPEAASKRERHVHLTLEPEALLGDVPGQCFGA